MAVVSAVDAQRPTSHNSRDFGSSRRVGELADANHAAGQVGDDLQVARPIPSPRSALLDVRGAAGPGAALPATFLGPFRADAV